MDKLLSFGPSFILFLLGIFLVLSAIVGGGLEIKEIKLPKIEKWPRFFTAVLGVTLTLSGACVGIFEFLMFLPPTTPPAPPTQISRSFTPATDYFQKETIQLPQDQVIPEDIEEEVAKLIVEADEAEILANFYQDDSYLQAYYRGDALLRLQQDVMNIKESGYIRLDNIDLENSYYVNMRLNSDVLSVDECEYWQTNIYDLSTGDLLEEGEWMLVPQTINIELVGELAYITTISFYQGEAFCTE